MPCVRDSSAYGHSTGTSSSAQVMPASAVHAAVSRSRCRHSGTRAIHAQATAQPVKTSR